jgi:hypothetical protein
MLPWTVCLFSFLVRPGQADIDRLIARLGSEVHAERQAATWALDVIGEPALEPLRRVCASTRDAEVRQRAARLVERLEERLAEHVAGPIKESTLIPEEKGLRLRRLVKVGMTRARVHQILGVPTDTWKVFNRSAISMRDAYSGYALLVSYSSRPPRVLAVEQRR